jgi:hypothetical protein
MEYGSATGELNNSQLSTLSKHQTTKCETHYSTELFKPAIRVMSGLKKNDDDCFVARTTIHPPNGMTQDQISYLLFSELELWRNQCLGPNKDKSTACYIFLFKVLLYLAMVVLQDGIYWISEFPSQPASLVLKFHMPPFYKHWAKGTRE